MKIVIEITSTGVNVYCEKSVSVEVFDLRSLEEEIKEYYVETAERVRENYEKSITHKTIGLIQVY